MAIPCSICVYMQKCIDADRHGSPGYGLIVLTLLTNEVVISETSKTCLHLPALAPLAF